MQNYRRGTWCSLAVAFAFIATTLVISADALAIRDEDNQGRWNKPCENGPDAVVPGFLVNMGPTGARGILKSRSYIVKYIFPSSPASRVLKIGDEVYGANGKKFSAHTFSGRQHGIEGPIQDLGLAIEDSEGGDGVLKLMVRRGGSDMTVDVQLERLGRFSDTFPVNCKKTDILKARAYKYLMAHPGGVSSQGRCVETLALLSADDPKVFAAGKRMAQSWNRPYNESTWSWHLGFQGITLGEYYLLTKDRKALGTLQSTLKLLRYSQWKGPNIQRWKVKDMKGKVDQETLDRHQALYDGGFGHCPYPEVVRRGGGGYGPMQWPTCLALMAWQLGKQCGLQWEHPGIEKGFQFLEYGTTVAGRVAYGGEFTLNNGPVDSKRWKANTSHGFSAKSGLGYIVYRLSPNRSDSAKMMRLHLSNINAAYPDMPDGHADALMGLVWGLAGVYASDDAALKKKITNYYKAWINMARCHGSDSYVILPGRDYADEAYYRGNIRNHTTAAIAFIYSYSTPKLQIQGVSALIPGVNHVALTGDKAAAYKAIVRKKYRTAFWTLKNIRSEDAEVTAMLEYIDCQWQQQVDALKKHEDSGEILALKEEVIRLIKQFRGVKTFDAKIETYEQRLAQDPWRKQALAGKAYLSYLGVLQKYKSPTALKKLDKFAKDNADNLYGKWAATVVEQFNENGTISVSSRGKPSRAM